MQPFALSPRSSRRVRHLSIRSHFHQPAPRVRLGVAPFKPDYAGMVIAVAVGLQIVFAIACYVVQS